MSTTSITDVVNSSVQCLSHLPKDNKAVDEYVSKVEAGNVEDVKTLDARLEPLTYLFENMLTKADVATYAAVRDNYSKLSSSEYYSTPSVTRYLNHIQSHPSLAPLFSYPNSPLSPITFDLSSMPPLERKPVAAKEKKPKKPTADVPAAAADQAKTVVEMATETAQSVASSVAQGFSEGQGAVAALGQTIKDLTIGGEAKVEEAGKKVEEGAAAAGAAVEGGAKKEKKQKEKKEKKPVAPAPEPTGPMPSMIELKVGHILSVEKHPDADSLYIEQVDVGEESPRTIISGLVKYMTLEQMKGSRIVVVANMKPVKMRGVTSYAMILCATSKDGKDSGLEFVAPPEASKPGDRIYFEGPKYENEKAVDVMNPKKKIFEAIQPQLTTLDTLEACFIDKETGEVSKIRTKDGYCTVKKFVGASLS